MESADYVNDENIFIGTNTSRLPPQLIVLHDVRDTSIFNMNISLTLSQVFMALQGIRAARDQILCDETDYIVTSQRQNVSKKRKDVNSFARCGFCNVALSLTPEIRRGPAGPHSRAEDVQKRMKIQALLN